MILNWLFLSCHLLPGTQVIQRTKPWVVTSICLSPEPKRNSQSIPGLCFSIFHHHTVERVLTLTSIQMASSTTDPKVDPLVSPWGHSPIIVDMLLNILALSQVIRHCLAGNKLFPLVDLDFSYSSFFPFLKVGSSII